MYCGMHVPTITCIKRDKMNIYKLEKEKENVQLIRVVQTGKEGKKIFVNDTIHQSQATPPHLQAEPVTKANSNLISRMGILRPSRLKFCDINLSYLSRHPLFIIFF